MKKKTTTRVQVELDPDTFEELLRLQKSQGARTYAEVVRKSIRLLTRIEQTRDKGGTVLRREADGTETEIWII